MKQLAIGKTVFVFVCSDIVLQLYFRLVTAMSQRIGNVRVQYFGSVIFAFGLTACFIDCAGIRPDMASCRRVGQNPWETG